MKMNTQGYSVIVSILMVGFLLVVSTGVFHLVLTELNDNRGRENYLRASAGAEGSLELALLQIKLQGYGYYDKIDNTVNDRSILLSQSPLSISDYRPNDVMVSYDMDSKVNAYSGSLDPLGFDILPLFFLDDSSTPEKRASQLTLDVLTGPSNISWNIVSTNGGISGVGNFTPSTSVQTKDLITSGFNLSALMSIEDFLSDTSRQGNYLILFNPENTDTITYSLQSNSPGEYFTKPRAEIISSAKVGKYKQSFRTIVDNTEYLNLLKYSVFSN